MNAAALALMASLALAQGSAPAGVSASPSRCDFGVVRGGQPVTCTFTVRNAGDVPRRISGVSLRQPLTMRRAPAVIAAGGEVTLHVELPTGNLSGPFDGVVSLAFGEGETLVLSVTGAIRQAIEFRPAQAFYLAGHQGETASQSLEIVVNEPSPVSLALASAPPAGTDLRLETLEPGRRFLLTLVLAADGPLGPQEHEVLVSTSEPSLPAVRVRARTWRRPRVYTFPDTVDMGAIPIAQILSDPARFSQTLMVYQRRGHDFEVRISIDSPAIKVTAVRGPQGDRYQATLAYVPGALVAGPVRATLVIETNDTGFGRIEVPVRGMVLASP
jgi:Protein of unknown function (DUF1573)